MHQFLLKLFKQGTEHVRRHAEGSQRGPNGLNFPELREECNCRPVIHFLYLRRSPVGFTE